MIMQIRRKRIYRISIWLMMGLVFLISILLITRASPNWISVDDYVEYWAAGRLNIARENPYDPAQLLPLQVAAGRTVGVPVMMWNPPWMLALVMPFSLLNFQFSRSLWFLFNLFLIVWSSDSSWKLYGGRKNLRWISLIIVFTYPDVLRGVLAVGQTGSLIFIGVVGFLFFLNQRKEVLAGFFLSLLSIKPHILLIFGLAVLIWTVDNRKWKILLGCAASLFLSSIVAWIINPSVFNQYVYAINNYPPVNWEVSTLGGFLRRKIDFTRAWLQFIPSLLGISWLIYYWLRNRNDWDWIDKTPLLLLVSFVTMAYGWPGDQIASLIAIIQIAVLLLIKPKGFHDILIIGSYIFILINLWMFKGNIFLLWWLGPVLLIYYLASRKLINYVSPDLI